MGCLWPVISIRHRFLTYDEYVAVFVLIVASRLGCGRETVAEKAALSVGGIKSQRPAMSLELYADFRSILLRRSLV